MNEERREGGGQEGKKETREKQDKEGKERVKNRKEKTPTHPHPRNPLRHQADPIIQIQLPLRPPLPI
jgi:hypothetical protein